VTLADNCRFTFEDSERGKQVMKKDEKKLSLSKRSTTPFDQKKFGS
jgi:hypothetical protein